MSYLLLGLLCVVFVELFVRLDITVQITSTMALSKEAMGVLASRTMTDGEKERFVRRRSLELMRETAAFTGKLLLICLVLLAVYLSEIHLFPQYAASVNADMLSIEALLVMTLIGTLYAWVRHVLSQRV